MMACATPEPAPAAGARPPVPQQLIGAAATPLNDLNLLHARIPAVLVAARKAPYLAPADPTCGGLTVEILALNAALGEDLDAPPRPGPGLLERGKTEVESAALGAVKSSAEALIPYRGWVRKLTGAERASREVTKAIAAGIVRRAYLKGLGKAQGCPTPAAPFDGSTAPEPAPPPGLASGCPCTVNHVFLLVLVGQSPPGIRALADFNT